MNKKMLNSINQPTPFFLIDLSIVQKNCRILKQFFPNIEIFYAIKANPVERILNVVKAEGFGFEVASSKELDDVLSVGASSDKIISSNPTKLPSFISDLNTHGINRFCFDSESELDKIASSAPNSRVYLRITTDNTGADWPLTNKFGADPQYTKGLFSYALSKGLIPDGLTFHIGSQCRNLNNWNIALETCARIIDDTSHLVDIDVINLGGGLPVQHTKKIPQLDEIASVIYTSIESLFDDRIVFEMEPGRFIVGEAAVLASSVIGKTQRDGNNWVYLDVGMFNGLMETVEKFNYVLDFENDSKNGNKEYIVAGPSCDSIDVMFYDQPLPNLEVGEKVYIQNAGAYTWSYASNFNGFGPPELLYTDELT